MAANLSDLQVIDTDSHVTESPDVWTARVPRKWLSDVPHVDRKPGTGRHHWRIQDKWLTPVGAYGRAGWTQYPPNGPTEYDQIDPGTWRAADRLERMDQFGIYAQLLHPNLIAQEIGVFLDVGADMATECARAYNDFILEFASIDRKRLLPIAMIPFWDTGAAVSEVLRAAESGHHGILFGNDYSAHGLPPFTDEHWHAIYAAAQDVGLPVVVHVGFCESREGAAAKRGDPSAHNGAKAACNSTISLMANAAFLARLVSSGLCDRFPRLRFVSIESGIGYVNYLLESLDWNWKVQGAHRSSPLLPSEYFKRQCYATFWFEVTSHAPW